MALKKGVSLDSTMDMLSGMSDQVKESKKKLRNETVSFKKPRGDYYSLDMVVRETVKGSKGHPVMTEEIKTNYKEYVSLMAGSEGISITKYIHKLLDEDMKQHEKEYKKLSRIKKQA